MNATIPENEAARLAASRQYGILDTAPEKAFNDIALLASQICGTPISLISLVDQDRQWFKAKQGVAVSETPRSIAFCAHGILQSDVFVVQDAHLDVRSPPTRWSQPPQAFASTPEFLWSRRKVRPSACCVSMTIAAHPEPRPNRGPAHPGPANGHATGVAPPRG